jgi:phosphohistidine phosphatase
MKRLYVLRHAKSSWDDASLADYDRPLNDRGLETAPFMGRLMRERGYLPDAVLSSPASRARTTAKLASEAAGGRSPILFDERIYEASPQTLVKVLSTVDDNASSAMVVGHNPGMEGLVRFLTGETAAMPTAGLAVMDLDIENWNKIDQLSGKLVEVLRPKEVGYST